MADLANNFEHAYRAKPNFQVRHLILLKSEGPNASHAWEDKIIEKVGETYWEFVPVLATIRGLEPYRAVASEALRWWGEFDPVSFQ
jgi:hypothetical protein